DEHVRKPQVASVEDLEFGPHAQGLDPLRPLPEHVRGGDVDVRPFAEVEGPAVDRGDLGQQLFDAGQTIEGVDEVGARHRRQRVVRVDDEVTAHAGCEVDDRVDIGCADPTDDLTVVGDLS